MQPGVDQSKVHVNATTQSPDSLQVHTQWSLSSLQIQREFLIFKSSNNATEPQAKRCTMIMHINKLNQCTISSINACKKTGTNEQAPILTVSVIHMQYSKLSDHSEMQ